MRERGTYEFRALHYSTGSLHNNYGGDFSIANRQKRSASASASTSVLAGLREQKYTGRRYRARLVPERPKHPPSLFLRLQFHFSFLPGLADLLPSFFPRLPLPLVLLGLLVVLLRARISDQPGGLVVKSGGPGRWRWSRQSCHVSRDCPCK